MNIIRKSTPARIAFGFSAIRSVVAAVSDSSIGITLLGLVAATAALLAAPSAVAQESPQRLGADVLIEEITVTARKREESIYETPMSISAFTEASMRLQGIDRMMDIGRFVPNLNITRFGVGNTSHATVFIRGIGLQDHIITTDPGVGIYLDGVYLGRQMGANLDLKNIERVEVLRGPQGTLYGRNSIGGAVNIITKRPSAEEEFQYELQAGSRGRAGANFYASQPDQRYSGDRRLGRLHAPQRCRRSTQCSGREKGCRRDFHCVLPRCA